VRALLHYRSDVGVSLDQPRRLDRGSEG